jgi:putative serine protease PepD
MYRIRFQTASRIWTFDEHRVVRVGSAPDSDIVLDEPGICPLHAELRPTDAGWELHNSASGSSTWVNGERVEDTTPLGPSTEMRFGAQDGGVDAVIAIEEPTATTTDEASQASDGDTTWFYSAESSGGQPSDGMLVRSRAGDSRFDSASTVRIGRDAGLDVVADDPAVSRTHAVLEHRPDGWWYVDQSRSGSYIDGQKIVEQKITQPTTVHLGHPTAGYEVELVPMVDIAVAQAAIAAKRRRTIAIRAAAIVGVLVLVGAGITAAVLLSGRGGKEQPSALTAAHLDRVKRASVQIVATRNDGTALWKGSGTIIGSDGLILTNAHVGHPSALPPGNPDHMDDAAVYLVALAKDDASPAEPRYRATTIVSDGYLDIAVMKINAKNDGSPLNPGPLGLPDPVPIGDSSALHTGDHITALGYPALTGTPGVAAGPLTITSGDVASFTADPPTHTDRFWIDSTERLGSGNSGGASINNAGEVIGINSAVVTAETSHGQLGEFTSGSSLIRPVALAADVIRIARNGGDPSYVSPYLAKLPHLDPQASAKSAGWTKTPSQDCTGNSKPELPQTLEAVAQGDVIYAHFQVAGVPDTTPFTVAFIDEDSQTILFKAQSQWKLGSGEQCTGAALKVPPAIHGADAVLIIGPQDEINVINPVKFG